MSDTFEVLAHRDGPESHGRPDARRLLVAKGIVAHVFRTDSNTYCWDAGASRIVRVGDAMSNLIGALSRESVAEREAGVRTCEDACGAPAVDGLFALIGRGQTALGVLQPWPDRLHVSIPTASGRANHAGMVLEVTDACNFRCKYCSFSEAYVGNRPHGSRTIRFDTARRAIDYLVEHSDAARPFISFYGRAAARSSRGCRVHVVRAEPP